MQQIIISTVPADEAQRRLETPDSGLPPIGYPYEEREAAPLFRLPSAVQMLSAFRRRWLLASCCGLLLAALADAGVWQFFPPKYTAYALLRISSTAPHLVYRDPTDGRYEFAVVQKTQAALIKSRFVLNAALRRINVHDLETLRNLPDPVTWLEEEIKVEFQDGSEILRISLSGPHAGELPVILNAIKDAYLQEIVYEDRNKKSQQLYELEQIKTKTEESIRAKKNALRELSNRLQVNEPAIAGLKQKLLMDQYLETTRERERVALELKKAQAHLQLQQAQSAEEKAPDARLEAAVEERAARDLEAQRLMTQIQALSRKLDHHRSVSVRPDEPLLARTLSDLRQAQEQLRRRKEQLRVLAAQELAQPQAKGDLAAMPLEHAITVLQQQEEALGQRVAQLSQELSAAVGSGFDLETMTQEIAQLESVATAVADRIGKLQVEMPSPHRITQLQPAEVPNKKDFRKQAILMAFAGVSAFGLGASAVSVADIHRRNRAASHA